MTSLGGLSASSFQVEANRIFAAIPPAHPSPMLHEIWLRACSLCLGPDASFEVITAESGDQPVAAAAFSRRNGICPHLSLLGAEELFYPSDILYKDEHAAAMLAAAVVTRKAAARFGHFPAESAFLGALIEASRRKGFVLATEMAGSPYIRIDESWRKPEQKLRARKMSDLRRRRKKAEAVGAVSFEVLAPRPHDVDALYEEVMAVEASGWKGRSGTALAFDMTQQSFFQNYTRLASEAGILRIAFMRLDGKAIAMQIGVLCDNAFWGLKSGYDENYHEFSPGKLLFLEVVRYVANSGVATHEFVGKPAPWTLEWTNKHRPLVRLRYYPFNPAGIAAFIPDGLAAVRDRVKTWLQKRSGS